MRVKAIKNFNTYSKHTHTLLCTDVVHCWRAKSSCKCSVLRCCSAVCHTVHTSLSQKTQIWVYKFPSIKTRLTMGRHKISPDRSAAVMFQRCVIHSVLQASHFHIELPSLPHDTHSAPLCYNRHNHTYVELIVY